jgi:hypothetical protein
VLRSIEQDFASQIPRGAQLIVQLRDDPGFNRWVRKVAQTSRELGQPVVYVYIEKLHHRASPRPRSRSPEYEFQGTIVLTRSIPVSVLAVQKRRDRLTVVPVSYRDACETREGRERILVQEFSISRRFASFVGDEKMNDFPSPAIRSLAATPTRFRSPRQPL